MKKGNRRYFLIGLLAFALFLAGTYAILATTLSITGTATGLTDFKIAFTTASVSVPEKANYTISPDGATLNISTSLAYPGDSVTVNFTIQNTGSLAAVVNNLTTTNSNNENFTVQINGLDNIVGTTLAVGATTTGSVVITWNASSTTATPEDVTFNVVIDYAQATT